MQSVKQSKFGAVESVRYNLYLNATEFNDIRMLLTCVTVTDSNPFLEDIRKSFIDAFINENTFRRLTNLTTQFCLEL